MAYCKKYYVFSISIKRKPQKENVSMILATMLQVNKWGVVYLRVANTIHQKWFSDVAVHSITDN